MSHELKFPPKPEVDRSMVMRHSARVPTLADLGLGYLKDKPASQPLPATDATLGTVQPPADQAAVIQALNALNERHIAPLFERRSATEWLELACTKPMPKMLFDTLWWEGELCILFADTNVGKSILAVQICDSISRGEPIKGLRMQAPAQPVAYFDFELSPMQFRVRCTNGTCMYPFSPGFTRLELDPVQDYEQWGFKTFEAFLHDQLERYISQTGVKVVVIDNISAICKENEKSKDAQVLMRMLILLKRKYDLSLLVLAHTPKIDLSKPLDQNCLQGSKQIANLCDSIIAVGKSHRDAGLRYIKQVKYRMGENMYDEDNVLICQIIKPDDFVHFELLGYGREREHLRETGDKELGSRIASIHDLAAGGMSQRDIAKQLGISAATVNRYMNKE